MKEPRPLLSVTCTRCSGEGFLVFLKVTSIATPCTDCDGRGWHPLPTIAPAPTRGLHGDDR